MHIEFDPNNVDWISFIHQPTTNQQFGGGTSYTAFTGIPYQRGNGIGSIFRSLLRFLIPIGKEAGVAIGRQGLQSGVRVLSNVLEGQDVRQSLEDEGRAGLKNLLDKASNNLSKRKNEQSGGASAFDFKRYKKGVKSSNINSFHSNDPDNTVGGPFTQQRREKSINKPANKYLHSSIGPPLLPKRRKKPLQNKRIRIDSLGAY